MTDYIIEELKKYAHIIEHEGIETKQIYELNGLIYKTIGVLKKQDKEIERLDKAAKDKYEYHTELIGKWAGECKDKNDEIESLRSLNDFQQQQISCMESDIDKMKCCGNCDNTEFDGDISIGCDLGCEGLSYWELKK